MAILLGPPEIYNSTHSAPSSSSSSTTVVSSGGDPFMDQMLANFNKTLTSPPRRRGLNMGFTENNSPTFLSSGDPCLDFFFHIVPDTPPPSLTQRLKLAWSHNPLNTLKLVCNLRGVRGTGKSDKEGFYVAALWIYTNHPKTLAINVPSFAEFGYFKDLPEILYRILEGIDVRKHQKDEWLEKKESILAYYHKKSRSRMVKKTLFAKASIPTREEKRMAMAKKVVQRYQEDSNFRLLYDHISDLFAKCLKEDVELLKCEKLTKISLAAKWCPSIDSSFDRSTLLCESIARRIFPRESYQEYQDVEETHYAYRIRDRLRKEVLVPLRKALELPEVYIGANQWGSLPYNRVASVAMKFYKEKFKKHDNERFIKYLMDVKSGKSTIAAGALLPHEIIASLSYGYRYGYGYSDDEEHDAVAELQWKRMVDDLLKKGKLRSSLAVCDVSGSMIGIPMDVSVAMGLLVSETSGEPWKGKVITFSRNPKLHLIKGEDLKSKVEFVRAMDWGANTDFQKVFDVILEVAVKAKLKEDQMIKRIFVFSDMEFDEASSNSWETDYEAIKRKYTDKGYGSVVPQIVFWNLRDSTATPVADNQDGVALVSGFSKNILKIFLDNDGAINPQAIMEAAISGKEYDKLLVLD